ncbi:MAG: outer membrane protein transport protein [Candidatus Hinthialibacter antarcticus]|nr:outer membrane protein transport protein [Candidatus Hinthialibacter antarcticus]
MKRQRSVCWAITGGYLGLLCLFASMDASAGLLNRLGSTSPMGLATSGAGDHSGVNPGPFNASLNPAALVTVDGVELFLGDVSVWTDFSYDQHGLLGGSHFDARDENFQFPEFALGWRIDENWIVAVQLSVPYGLASDFRDLTVTFPGYNTELSDLQTSIAAAYQFNDEFSVGATLNIDYFDLTYRLPVIVGGTYLGHNSGEADGFGVSGSIGALWRPGPWSLGVKYSFPSSVDLDGHSSLPAALGVTSDDFSSEVDIPQRVGVGVAYEFSDWWTSAVDATYTDYEQSDLFSFHYENAPDASLPLYWKSVWSVHAGNFIKVTDQLTWKHGAGWLSSAMPDDVLIPSIPDTPGWIVSTGLAYEATEWMTIDVSLAYAWGDRNVGFDLSRPSSGDIHSDVWLAGIGLNFRF